MIDEKLTVPLSPPNSPRMSDEAAKVDAYRWQRAPTSALKAAGLGPIHSEQKRPDDISQPSQTASTEQSQQPRPSLRSYKSFPYSLGPSSRIQNEVTHDQAAAEGLGEFTERVISQGPQPTGSSSLQQPTFGGSAPTSPAGRLTPNSPNEEHEDEQMEDDEIDFGTAEQEEGAEKRPMTAAELRAYKRKMKRFRQAKPVPKVETMADTHYRLTHNQTRFLMSEFARQAHPDAAHRERLSREIPGLSSRQVQVWFQNR